MKDKQYDALVKQAKDLVVKKAQDYQGGSVGLHDYFPFGDQSYVQMLYVKAMRLRSLVEGTRSPNFESTKDSVLDLINYAIFYLEYLEEQEND